MRRRISLTIFFALILGVNSLFSQVENKSSLTIEQIMKGNDFVGHLPSGASWSEDSKTIYFSWNPDSEKLSSDYKIDVADGNPVKLTDDEIKAKIGFGTYTKNRSHKVYTKNGDIFILELASKRVKQVTNTIDWESNVSFSGDDNKIIYRKGNNFYTWGLLDGTTTQITNFVKGLKKRDKKQKENEQWLENDQLTYFEILRERKETKELRKEQRERFEVERPTAIYYGNNRVSNIQVSPNLKYVTYRISKNPKAKRTKVPDYVTESGYINDLSSRPKVGSPQTTYEFWIYNIEKDTAYQVDSKQFEGIYDKPTFLKEYHKGDKPYDNKYKKPREVIVHGVVYAENGKALIEAKALDNKDRWIMLLNMEDGSTELIERQRDEAWIGGPGIHSWNGVPGTKSWIDDERLYYQSEATGYSHLYCYNIKTKKKKQLTKGKFEIIRAALSKDKQHFYITSNKENPHEHHFYKMSVEGGDMKKITQKAGNYNVSMSPDEKYLAIRYSYSNKPWELYLMENKAGAEMKQLTKSTTTAFDKYQWLDPEIVSFKAADGAKVPARIYRPENAQKGDPAVIFVHGAGYLQNVHRWWSSYYREYMFHNILVDNGYTVLDIDYRASNGYGRDWRTGIYRFMGGKDLDDQVDGAKFLVKEYGVDADKIGIYGGSYGGFITLMALFTKPNTFKSGAALRSVTDWAHYNHGYTSNILNTPVQDSIAYYKSSPIYHAEGLQDNLLILHGMVDTNVQFQDVVRLAQRLVELGKDNWEFAVFPMEGHGFVESTSWADEYKRIFKLFQTTLK